MNRLKNGTVAVGAPGSAMRLECEKEDDLEECDHSGYVFKKECEKCGKTGLESDAEIYTKEAPL